MMKNWAEWPSNRGPITKIMSSDGCKGNSISLAVGQWYHFHEVGCHLGNVWLKALSIHLKGVETPSAADSGYLSPSYRWADYNRPTNHTKKSNLLN
jgi:hypothetical protein